MNVSFMKKSLRRGSAALLTLIGIVSVSGCGESSPAGGSQLSVAAGMPPVAYLAKRIGGDAVRVATMLPEGRNPHDYSPGPREVRDAAASRLFLSVGMRFESALTRPLRQGRTRVVDVARGIVKLPMRVSGEDAERDHHHAEHHDHHHAEHHDHHDHHDHCCDEGDGLDPHVWLDADNACRMAENICEEFCVADSERAALYRKNCARLTGELRELGARLKAEMRPYAGRRFYVYHPAFGYFANMLGLRQEAVELGGREVTPARMAEVVRRARTDKVRTIFVQPQFSPSSTRALERELGVTAVPADPLREDLVKNFSYLAEALKKGFDREPGGDRDTDN